MSSSSAAGTANGGGGGGAGNKVTVTETEYSLKLSQNSFKPGTYTFTVDNAGKITHALEIEGPGMSDTKTKSLQSGATQPLTVTLKKGTYEMYCPVPGHKQLGMDTHIKVS
ncbi:plastocyanin/azurin family copper-binding protein [Streptomyces sp. NPDC101152]|uniref:plastocyanin/azurin family copper-binding protein n=1 Tax=Streptomyces sp. NPDC101152 TaxID=3366116 RepID=UPI0038049257